MKTKDVLAALAKRGTILCKGFTKDSRCFWLHPMQVIVPTHLAEQIIELPGVEPCGDALLDGASQTWKLA